MLNLMVQVVARPRPIVRHISSPDGPGLDPAEALVGGILRVGIQPGGGFAVRHLLEEPVLVVIAFADGVGDVVGEQERIAHAPAPEPVVRAVALVKFAAGAVGVADFPDLFAVAHGLPVQLAQVHRLARFNGDVGLGEFAQHPVGKRMQRVGAGADVGHGEFTVFAAIGPELVVIAVMRPSDQIAVARPQNKRAGSAGVIRVSQADGQMGQLGGGRLRVVEHKLAGDGAALIFVRVVHAVDPIVGPRGLCQLGFVQRILPKGHCIVMPDGWHGRIAGGGR